MHIKKYILFSMLLCIISLKTSFPMDEQVEERNNSNNSSTKTLGALAVKFTKEKQEELLAKLNARRDEFPLLIGLMEEIPENEIPNVTIEHLYQSEPESPKGIDLSSKK